MPSSARVRQSRTLATAAAITAMVGLGLPTGSTAASLSFDQLTGLIGGSPAETSVYDLARVLRTSDSR